MMLARRCKAASTKAGTKEDRLLEEVGGVEVVGGGVVVEGEVSIWGREERRLVGVGEEGRSVLDSEPTGKSEIQRLKKKIREREGDEDSRSRINCPTVMRSCCSLVAVVEEEDEEEAAASEGGAES